MSHTRNPRICWMVYAFLLGLIVPPIGTAKIIYVNDDAVGANNGTSWVNAYKHLQDALAAAGRDDEIWVAAGTYKPDQDTAYPSGRGSRSMSFDLKSNVGLYGGFAGHESSRGERDWPVNETILSGDVLIPGWSNDNSYHVVTASSVDATAVLDGFTVTAGRADTGVSADDRNNFGAGMLNEHSGATVNNCLFIGNIARPQGWGQGGAMYNDHGAPTLTNCTFKDNEGNQGGAIFNMASEPKLINCTLVGNKGTTETGGVFDLVGDSTFVNCLFRGNTAPFSGGAVWAHSGNATFVNCAFSGNSTGWAGGGVQAYNGGKVDLINCTFAGNRASGSGDALLVQAAEVSMVNCIVWGGVELEGMPGAKTVLTVSHSDLLSVPVEGPGTSVEWGAGNIAADPCFVDSGYGPDEVFGTEDDNLRLLPDSPCIDTGDNSAVPADVTTDLDGNARIANARVDMGAYEYGAGPDRPATCTAYPAMDFNQDCKVDFRDFAIFVQSWLECNLDPPEACWD
ncbi:MAG: right-handed parallel beta-helix repeat-containing protein [Phycisphaerales bacterium]|nr:MAG: right-handed parallel beta-helix repeat-containing protein [Phycisphaerales bacterium]